MTSSSAIIQMFSAILLLGSVCTNTLWAKQEPVGKIQKKLEDSSYDSEYVKKWPGDKSKFDGYEIPRLPDPERPVRAHDNIGKIPDIFNVDSNGTVRYSIPITVPIARNNSQPQLSLSYNSSTIDGPIGIGWSLSGLSAITRCPSTYGQDEILREVSFDNDLDNFCLDGQRLVEHGPNTFRVLNDPSILVSAINLEPGMDDILGWDSFIVRDLRTGNRRIYGCRDDQNDEMAPPYSCSVVSREIERPTSTSVGIVRHGTISECYDCSAAVIARGGVPRIWGISKETDQQGNATYYKYNNIKNLIDDSLDGFMIRETGETLEWTIQRIDYNVNLAAINTDISSGASSEVAGLPGLRRIDFSYGDSEIRNDAWHGFLAGGRIQSTQLLQNVSVSGPDDFNWLYELQYEQSQSTGKSRLVQVNLSEKTAGMSMRPTTFTWQNGETGFSPPFTNSMPTVPIASQVRAWDIPHNPVPLDINGDGYTDLAYPRDHSWRFILNEGVDDQTGGWLGFSTEQNSNETALYETPNPLVGERFMMRLAHRLDYNQDGLDDLLLLQGGPYWEVLVSNGDSFTREIADFSRDIGTDTGHTYFGSNDDKSRFSYVADLDGDGVKDLLFCQSYISSESVHQRDTWFYTLNRDGGFGPATAIEARCDNTLLLDYNTDGAADLLYADFYTDDINQTYYQIRFTNGTHRTLRTNLPYFPALDGYHATKIVDSNGDGLEDVIIFSRTGFLSSRGFSRMWINTGDGFMGGQFGLPTFDDRGMYHELIDNTQAIQFFDYDGDGLQDLLVPSLDEWNICSNDFEANTKGRWKILRGTGNYRDVTSVVSGWWSYEELDTGIEFCSRHWALQPPRIMDLNGDFIPDLLEIGNSTFVAHIHAGDAPNLLVKIRDGMVGIEPERHPTYVVEYKPATDPTVYDKCLPEQGTAIDDDERVSSGCAKEPFSIDSRIPARHLVSTHSIYNGNNGQKVFQHKYFDSRYDLKSRINLGIGQTHVTDLSKGEQVITTYDNHTHNNDYHTYPHLRNPKIEVREVELDSSEKRREVTQYIHDVHAPDDFPNLYIPFTKRKIELRMSYWDAEWKELARRVVDTLPNDWGDIQLKTTEISRDNVLLSRLVQDTDYTRWQHIESLPKLITDTSTDSSGESQSRSILIEYDTSERTFNLPKTVIREPGTDQFTTQFSYDNYGNVLTRLESDSYTNKIRTVEYDYDSEKMFPQLIINSGLNAFRFRYHQSLGMLLSKGDSNGNWVNYVIDHFGRHRGEWRSNGNWSTTTIATVAEHDAGREWGTIHDFNPEFLSIFTENSYGAKVQNTYDRLGRLVEMRKNSLETGVESIVRQVYDEHGNLAGSSRPSISNEHTGQPQDLQWNKYQYDALGRILTSTAPDDALTENIYKGPIHVIVDPEGNETKLTYNANWKVSETEDERGVTVSHEYGPFEFPKRDIVQSPEITTDLVTDKRVNAYGLLERLIDPDMGTIVIDYNGWGEVIQTDNDLGETVSFEYDDIGRPTGRTDDDGTYAWRYDNGGFIGALHWSQSADYHFKEYLYRSDGNIATVIDTVNDKRFEQEFEYDHLGRLEIMHYPVDQNGNEFSVRLEYSPTGYLNSVKNAESGQSYWQLEGVDAQDRVVERWLGDNIKTVYGYAHKNDDTLRTITTTREAIGLEIQPDIVPPIAKEYLSSHENEVTGNVLQDLVYDYDLNRNVKYRHDKILGIEEVINYDEFNRIDDMNSCRTSTSECLTFDFDYDDIGNLTYKTGVGNYIYDYEHQPHAVRSTQDDSVGDNEIREYDYDRVGNQFLRPNEVVKNTTFNKPYAIEQPGTGIATLIEYNSGFNRVWQSNAGRELVTIDGLYQEHVGADGEISNTYNVIAQGEVIANVNRDSHGELLQYVLSDALGSPNTMLDGAGVAFHRFYFDAFGMSGHELVPFSEQMRNDVSVTGRTFTGHEYGEDIRSGLMSMGGREYDPTLGRFLSPDLLFQLPVSSQSYNRYSYVMNNPMTFIDPTGWEQSQTHSDEPQCGDPGVTCIDFTGFPDSVTGTRPTPPIVELSIRDPIIVTADVPESERVGELRMRRDFAPENQGVEPSSGGNPPELAEAMPRPPTSQAAGWWLWGYRVGSASIQFVGSFGEILTPAAAPVLTSATAVTGVGIVGSYVGAVGYGLWGLGEIGLQRERLGVANGYTDALRAYSRIELTGTPNMPGGKTPEYQQGWRAASQYVERLRANEPGRYMAMMSTVQEMSRRALFNAVYGEGIYRE